MTVLLEEFCPLDGACEPLGILLHFVVKHCEHPDFPTLKPDEFVCVINASVTVETAEIAAKNIVLRVFKPERKTIFPQFFFIA